MKYTNADLTRWLQAANAALAENDLECVVTSREGRGEVRTPKGGIVTAWASGKVSAGGNVASRDEVMSVMTSAELLVGHKPGATGGMLLKMPEPPVQPANLPTDWADSYGELEFVDLIEPAAVQRRRRQREVSDLFFQVDHALDTLKAKHSSTVDACEALGYLRDLVALALNQPRRMEQ